MLGPEDSKVSIYFSHFWQSVHNFICKFKFSPANKPISALLQFLLEREVNRRPFRQSVPPSGCHFLNQLIFHGQLVFHLYCGPIPGSSLLRSLGLISNSFPLDFFFYFLLLSGMLLMRWRWGFLWIFRVFRVRFVRRAFPFLLGKLGKHFINFLMDPSKAYVMDLLRSPELESYSNSLAGSLYFSIYFFFSSAACLTFSFSARSYSSRCLLFSSFLFLFSSFMFSYSSRSLRYYSALLSSYELSRVRRWVILPTILFCILSIIYPLFVHTRLNKLSILNSKSIPAFISNILISN